jgi:hypothetical protein
MSGPVRNQPRQRGLGLGAGLEPNRTERPSKNQTTGRLPGLVANASIESFRWHIAFKATLWGVNEMLGIGWLPNQPSHASDDVATPVFEKALVIVIPSHILDSV